MKIRTGFVTNSSSASYLCVFARVADKEKAKPVIKKYARTIREVNLAELLQLIDRGYQLNHDMLGVDVRPSSSYLSQFDGTDTTFVYIDDYCGDLHPGDPDTDPDFEESYDDPGEDVHGQEVLGAADDISEINGFADIDKQRGYGFDG